MNEINKNDSILLHSKKIQASYASTEIVTHLIDMTLVGIIIFFYEAEVGLNIWLIGFLLSSIRFLILEGSSSGDIGITPAPPDPPSGLIINGLLNFVMTWWILSINPLSSYALVSLFPERPNFNTKK